MILYCNVINLPKCYQEGSNRRGSIEEDKKHPYALRMRSGGFTTLCGWEQ